MKMSLWRSPSNCIDAESKQLRLGIWDIWETQTLII